MAQSLGAEATGLACQGDILPPPAEEAFAQLMALPAADCSGYHGPWDDTLLLARQLPLLNWGAISLLASVQLSSVQFSSVTQSCPTLWDPMNRSMPGLPVHHNIPEFTQTHVLRVRDTIQPSHPRSPPSLPVPNPSQHQSLFQ